MYDLHTHSFCSDGDLSPSDVVKAVHERGLRGFSLNDHNGLWGLEEAATAAEHYKLTFLNGVEISTNYKEHDVHILGFAQEFKTEILEQGLSRTRQGCRIKMEAMVQKCIEAGFTKVSMQSIEERYKQYKNPSFISFDLARELQAKHNLPLAEAHKMTVFGGTCYVPHQTEWLMSPAEAIALLHSAGGVAVWAHPGINLAESDETAFTELLQVITSASIDGIEVRHPFHDEVFIKRMAAYAQEHGLLVTAGSDWHGPTRFAENNARFGKIGVSDEEWTRLLTRCAELI